MSSILFSTKCPSWWRYVCKHGKYIFSDAAWQNHLHMSFKCETLYCLDENNKAGMVVSVYKVGPFRVGYVGFPVGEIIGDQKFLNDVLWALKNTSLPIRVDILRIMVSEFQDIVISDQNGMQAPETAIVNLQTWRLPSKIRRNINKFSRSNIHLEEIEDIKYSKPMFSLYEDTVKRNQGQIRYTEPYFRSLIRLSVDESSVRCIGAFSGDKLVGYLVVAISGMTANYLHGATDHLYSKDRVSDGLYHEMITWAKSQGARCMNFLSSPKGQRSLSRYKEKWGGKTRVNTTYEFVINKIYAYPFLVISRIYSLQYRMKMRLKKIYFIAFK